VKLTVDEHPYLVSSNEQSLLRLLAGTLLKPTQLGFSLNDEVLLRSAMSRACSLIETLLSKTKNSSTSDSAPVTKIQILSAFSNPLVEGTEILLKFSFKTDSSFTAVAGSERKNITANSTSSNMLSLQELSCLIRGFQELHKAKLLSEFLSKQKPSISITTKNKKIYINIFIIQRNSTLQENS
jgi:hypothetical protein